jgi:hypothetical protein
MTKPIGGCQGLLVSQKRPTGDGPVRTLTLEIEVDSDPISGRLTERGTSGRSFVGWLGLARALELVLDTGERDSST